MTVQFLKTYATVSNPYPEFCTVTINNPVNNIGDQVTVTVTMKQGADFVGWHRSDQAQIASASTSYSFTVPAQINLEPVITLNQSTAKGFSRIIDATITDRNSLLTLIDDNFNYTQVVTAIGGLRNFSNQEKLALGRAKACEFIKNDFELQTDCSDAGSVIYIDKNNNIYAQGTSLYYVTDGYTCTTANVPNVHIGGFNSTISQSGSNYNISVHVSASVSGYTLDIGKVYLGRNENSELDVTTEQSADGSQNWRIESLEEEKQFFVKPKFEVSGKYYATLRTAFSYTVKHPDKVKVFMVTETDEGVATLQQFEENAIVPPALPVVIQCETNNVEDNVLIPIAPLFDAKYRANNTILYNKYGYRQHDYYCSGTQSNNNIDTRTEDGIGYFKVKYTKANTVPIYKLDVNEDGEVGFWTKVAQNEVISGNEAYSYTPCALFKAKTPVIELDKTEAYTTEGILATITTATSGATILYSLDGGETWTEYAEPVAITQESAGEYTILAKASKAGYIDSDIAKVTYTFVAGEYSPVTLANLIASGDTEGKYIITDLTAVDVVDDELIICKDDNGYANPDAMPEGETWVDYMSQSKASIENDLNLNGREEGITATVPEKYDQSNWIALHLPEGHSVTSVTDWQGRRLSGVKGRLLSATNPEFQLLDAMPTSGEDVTIAPNVYVAASFNGYNHQRGTKAPFIGTEFFFVQPKPMELATIGWAQWDAEYKQFVVPYQKEGLSYDENNPEWNTAGLSGHFGFNGSLLEQELEQEQEGYAPLLQDGHSYLMPALIKYKVGGNSQPALAPRRAGEVAKEYVAYPLRLVQTTKELNGVITGVTAIGGSRAVAGVDYYNLAGQRSSRPWQGVNIVVTRYSDGTTSTCKQIKN